MKQSPGCQIEAGIGFDFSMANCKPELRSGFDTMPVFEFAAMDND
jgi:hypothetical protein